MAERLVLEVSKYPEIFDPNNMRYRDVKLKDNIFTEIAQHLDLTGKYMLFIFNRFKKRISNYVSVG
jgi:hypothetical protein